MYVHLEVTVQASTTSTQLFCEDLQHACYTRHVKARKQTNADGTTHLQLQEAAIPNKIPSRPLASSHECFPGRETHIVRSETLGHCQAYSLSRSSSVGRVLHQRPRPAILRLSRRLEYPNIHLISVHPSSINTRGNGEGERQTGISQETFLIRLKQQLDSS